jgi:hypothetical protein
MAEPVKCLATGWATEFRFSARTGIIIFFATTYRWALELARPPVHRHTETSCALLRGIPVAGLNPIDIIIAVYGILYLTAGRGKYEEGRKMKI